MRTTRRNLISNNSVRRKSKHTREEADSKPGAWNLTGRLVFVFVLLPLSRTLLFVAVLDFTFESICEIAFGVKLHQLGSKSPHPFCMAFDEAQGIIAHRALSPPILWKTMRALNLGQERKFKQHIRTINAFIGDIVRDRKKNAAEYADRNDLLSLFVADAAKTGEDLTDKHLSEIILNFMVRKRGSTIETSERGQTSETCS